MLSIEIVWNSKNNEKDEIINTGMELLLFIYKLYTWNSTTLMFLDTSSPKQCT